MKSKYKCAVNPVLDTYQNAYQIIHQEISLTLCIIIKCDKMNTIIVSPGGVGTTFIMQHFSRYLHVNCVHDSDGLKHVNNPLILSKFKNVRVLVIIGNEVKLHYLFRDETF